MKVLVVIDAIWPPALKVAGISSIYELYKEIAKQGIETYILTSIQSWADPDYKNWFKQEEKRTSIRFHYVDVRIAEKIKISPLFLSKILMFPKILRLHSRYKFDILHNYVSAPILFYLIGIYKKLLGLKGVVTLCTYNTSWIGSVRFAQGIKHIDKVICVTKHIRDFLSRKSNFQGKVTHIPVGLDINRFNIVPDYASFKDNLNIPEKNKTILFVGRITKEKGIFVFIQAATLVLNSHPEAIFIIATYGSSGLDKHHNRHKKLVLNLIKRNQKSFRLIEGIQDIPLLMHVSDIFVLPQITPHGTLGYPLTLLEAMASGKPIIASDTPGVNELIIDSFNGLLFEAGNPDKLARSIIELLSREELRQEIASRAAAGLTENFNITKNARILLGIYNDVLKNDRLPLKSKKYATH